MYSVRAASYGKALASVAIDPWKPCFKYLCIDIKYTLVDKALQRWAFSYLYNAFIDGSDVTWHEVAT